MPPDQEPPSNDENWRYYPLPPGEREGQNQSFEQTISNILKKSYKGEGIPIGEFTTFCLWRERQSLRS